MKKASESNETLFKRFFVKFSAYNYWLVEKSMY